MLSQMIEEDAIMLLWKKAALDACALSGPCRSIVCA